MNRYLIIITVLATAVLCACSDEESQKQDDRQTAKQLPILLGSSVGDGTRSNNATNLISGDTVYVWADMINGATQAVGDYFNAWALRANGVGVLTTIYPNNEMLFPATNKLNFYALVGNFGKGDGLRAKEPYVARDTTEFPATGIRHTVLCDQSTSTAYYKSDLLYAVVKNQEPVSQAVVLPFKHLLSRIQVVLVAGNGMTTTDLSSATVKLLNMKYQVIFSPDKTLSFASQSDLESMLGTPLNPQVSDILMATHTVSTTTDASVTNGTAYADAIVVPQTIAKGTAFIQVDYKDRTTYYRIPNGTNDEPLVIQSGKQYRFRLIADRIGETFEFTPVEVEEWGANTNKGLWLDDLESVTPLPEP